MFSCIWWSLSKETHLQYPPPKKFKLKKNQYIESLSLCRKSPKSQVVRCLSKMWWHHQLKTLWDVANKILDGQQWLALKNWQTLSLND